MKTASIFHITDKKKKARQGIALVITIGFLAVLTIIAVGFAVSMRTEHMASSAFNDLAHAQALMDVALNRAICDIYDAMGAEVYIPQAALYSDPSPAKYSGGSVTNASNTFPGEEAWLHIPGSLSNFAVAAAADAEWWRIATSNKVLLYDEFDVVTGETWRAVDKVGQVAYIILDCSGFLDANYLSTNDRWQGDSPREIYADNLPDYLSVDGPEDLQQRRQTNTVRFETFSILRDNVGTLPIKDPPHYMFNYSYFLPETENPYGGAKILITNDMSVANQEEQIMYVLTNYMMEGAGTKISKEHAGPIFTSIYDFVDADSIPGGSSLLFPRLDQVTMEDVPMINEITLSNEVVCTVSTATNLVFRYRLTMYVEAYIPHAPNNNDVYELPPNPLNSGQLSLNLVVGPGLVPASWNAIPTGTDWRSDLSTNDVSYIRGTNAVFTFVWEKLWSPPAVPPPNVSIKFDLRASINNMRFRNTTDNYDSDGIAMSAPINFGNIQFQRLSPFSVGDRMSETVGLEVRDCRFNHINAMWIPYTGWKANSLGNTNDVTDINEGWSPMYVPNGPISNIALLGYIPLWEPCRTFALCDRPGLTWEGSILDYFTDEIMVKPRYGIVNINSPERPVLEALFENMPIQDFPGQINGIGRVNSPLAADIADDIISSASWPIESIAEIGNVDEIRNYDTTDARRESLIRNSIHLFGVRQGLFTVILATRLKNSSGTTLAEDRGVALVWIDPLKIEKPYIRYLIRTVQ